MRIAITADLQFDTYRSLSRMDPASGLTSRLSDCANCFKWFTQSAVEHECEQLAVLGDVFNSRTAVDISVLHTVASLFATTVEFFERVTVVIGNHDSYLRNPLLNSVQALSGHVDVIDRPAVHSEIAFVPWHDDPLAYDGFIQSVFCEDWRPRFLMSHLLLQGAIGEHVDVGLPLSTIYPDEFEAVFLGDVHAPVEVAPGVQYVGAPMHFNYGDSGARGYWILDTDTAEYWFVENEMSPRFYIVRDAAKLDEVKRKIRSCDFLRLEVDPSALTQADLEELRERTAWVESTAPEMENIKPRLNVRSSDKHGEVLRRYVEYAGPDLDTDRLVREGLSIVEAVT